MFIKCMISNTKSDEFLLNADRITSVEPGAERYVYEIHFKPTKRELALGISMAVVRYNSLEEVMRILNRGK